MFNQTKDFQNIHPGEEAGEKRIEFGVIPLPGCPCSFIVTVTLVLDKEFSRGQPPAPCLKPPVLSRGQPPAPASSTLGFAGASPDTPAR